MDSRIWMIPAVLMKTKRNHHVPMSTCALEIVDAARSLTGRIPLMFPN